MNQKKRYFQLSTFIAMMTTFFVPSNPDQSTGILRYQYGFPMNYVTFFQSEPSSRWFGYNFFNGNEGLAIDPAIFIVNIVIIYFVIVYAAKIYLRFLGQ